MSDFAIRRTSTRKTLIYSDKGGLFELIAYDANCCAGKNCWQAGCSSPAGHEEILAQASSSRELRPHLDLREDLALLAQMSRSDMKVESTRRLGHRRRSVHFPTLFFEPLRCCWRSSVSDACPLFRAALLPLWSLVAILGCDFVVIFSLTSVRCTECSDTRKAPAGMSTSFRSARCAVWSRNSFESPKLRRCGVH